MLDSYFEQLRVKVLAQRAASPPPDIATMREATRKETQALGPGPELARVEDLQIKTRGGKLSLRLFAPPHPEAVIVFSHGGGWALGTVDDFDSLARALSLASNALIVMPEYRLAPEHPYPAGLEDVMDTFLWAQNFAAAQRWPLMAMGDSAGANLTLAAALELYDQVTLSHIFSLFAVVDCDFDKPSYRENGTAQLFTAKAMQRFFDLYAPPELWSDPKISVINHPNLAKLSAVTVLSCGCDLLKDDSIALLEALQALEVKTQHLRYESAPHAFMRHYRQSELARQAVEEVAQAIKAAIKQSQ